MEKQPTMLADGTLIRDWFAAQALQGLIASQVSSKVAGDISIDDHEGWARIYAKASYSIADAMLAERKAKP